MKRTGLKRRTPLRDRSGETPRTVRYLAAGEPDPKGTPRRYKDSRGYFRLRWKVGPTAYAERWERDEAGELVCDRPRWRPGMQRKRPELKIDLAELRRLHVEEKLLQPEIARRLGVNSGSVSRALRHLGLRAHRPQNPDSAAARFKRELDRMRPIVAARSGGICEVKLDGRCRRRATHVHHRKLRGNGGDNAIENLLHVCSSCHSRLHGLGSLSYEHGWLVESWNDPAVVPVQVGL